MFFLNNNVEVSTYLTFLPLKDQFQVFPTLNKGNFKFSCIAY